MKVNSIVNITLVIVIILVIAIPSVMKVKEEHLNALIMATEKKIIETAKDCYNKDKCLNNKILLKELYEYNLLEEMANPVTKEYYHINSYIEVDNAKFIEVKE